MTLRNYNDPETAAMRRDFMALQRLREQLATLEKRNDPRELDRMSELRFLIDEICCRLPPSLRG